jgi:hypothetical protein
LDGYLTFSGFLRGPEGLRDCVSIQTLHKKDAFSKKYQMADSEEEKWMN